MPTAAGTGLGGMLRRYWLDRFARVLLLAALLLGAVEYLQARSAADLVSVLIWSTAAAAVSASLATFWSYRRSCARLARAGDDPRAG